MILSSRQTYFLLSYTHRKGMNIPKVARMRFLSSVWVARQLSSIISRYLKRGPSCPGESWKEKKLFNFWTLVWMVAWYHHVKLPHTWVDPVLSYSKCNLPHYPHPHCYSNEYFHFPFKHDVTFLGLANRENILMLICINLFPVGALFERSTLKMCLGNWWQRIINSKKS